MSLFSRLHNIGRMLNGDRYIHPLDEAKYETAIGWQPDERFTPVYGPTASGETEFTRQIREAKPEVVRVARTVKEPIRARLAKVTR